MQAPRLIAILAVNLTKRKIVGTEPTLPTIHDLNVIFNKKEKRIPTSKRQQPKIPKNQQTIYAAPALRETVEARAYSTTDPPTTYANDTTIECNGLPTEDWLKRQTLATIKRPLQQPGKEEIYIQDKDYRGDHTHHTNLLTQPPSTIKEQSIATQLVQNENVIDDQSSSQTTEEDTYGSTGIHTFPAISPSRLTQSRSM